MEISTMAATEEDRMSWEMAKSGDALGSITLHTTEDEIPSPIVNDRPTPRVAVIDYLKERVPEFRRLSELRVKGWENKEGDEFFEKQRRQADYASDSTAQYFFEMMKKIGQEMDRCTGAFQIRNAGTAQPRILDMCMAPGGYLATALRVNPGALALAFSLPTAMGGHKIRLERRFGVTVKLLDITMLAEDMGVTDIPPEHPDRNNFLPRQFTRGQTYDLILCDGQVLRTHQRAPYREQREARRLTASQLALGLEHARPGATMVLLLHKLEAWDNVKLLHIFSQFSSVQLFKPRKNHAKRSSFYMVASNIQNQCPEAIQAIQRWKTIWRTATFGDDDLVLETLDDDGPGVEAVLRDFGPDLIRIGRRIWEIQANALAKAPFIKSS